jgi:subtilisin family serine protease
MPNQSIEYYYVGDKKVKLNKLLDSFAVKYKEDVPPHAIERKLLDMPDLADAEERKDMPVNRLLIVTLPQSRRLADVKESLQNIEDDERVEFVIPVYREPQSGLRIVVTDEIIVRFKSDVSNEAIDRLNKETGVEIIKKDRYVPNQYTLKVKDPNKAFAIANKYHESNLTEFAEPNFFSEIKKASIPYIEQWHLCNTGQRNGLVGEDVRAKEAWSLTKGSPNIIVAVIDDGVDLNHPDLKPNIWTNPDSSQPCVHGWNFFSNTDNPNPQKFTPPYYTRDDNDSHGTSCAGVIAATGDGELGIVGIAPECRILPVKIFMGNELPQMGTVAEAIHFAGENADILSNSWKCPENDILTSAIKDVVQDGRGGKGCPVFVASGNSSKDEIAFPSSVPDAIAIGASTNKGEIAAYSNCGEGLAFVAPSDGGTKEIFTTDVSIPGRGYNVGDVGKGDAQGLYTNSFGGTSSATPLAAGVAALILSLNPSLRWDQVRKYMRDTADKIDPKHGKYIDGYSKIYGYGRINAYKALKAVKDDMEKPPEPSTIIERNVSLNVAIPDNDLNGIVSKIQIDEEGIIESVEAVSVDISHTYRGDLFVSLISPDNTIIPLHEGEGGGTDNLKETYDSSSKPALKQFEGKSAKGKWQLRIVDKWASDSGTLNNWGLKIKVKI